LIGGVFDGERPDAGDPQTHEPPAAWGQGRQPCARPGTGAFATRQAKRHSAAINRREPHARTWPWRREANRRDFQRGGDTSAPDFSAEGAGDCCRKKKKNLRLLRILKNPAKRQAPLEARRGWARNSWLLQVRSATLRACGTGGRISNVVVGAQTHGDGTGGDAVRLGRVNQAREKAMPSVLWPRSGRTLRQLAGGPDEAAWDFKAAHRRVEGRRGGFCRSPASGGCAATRFFPFADGLVARGQRPGATGGRFNRGGSVGATRKKSIAAAKRAPPGDGVFTGVRHFRPLN